MKSRDHRSTTQECRRAFAHAIDIEKLGNDILHGYEPPALGGLFPPGFPGHSPGIVLPYDPALAQALLAEAGYPTGRGFPVVEMVARAAPLTPATVRRTGFNSAIVAYLTERWQEVLKVELDVKLLSLSAFLERVQGHRPHIALSIWGSDYPDPDDILSWASKMQWWQDPRYEQLLAKAREEPGHDRRMTLYRAAHQLLLEEAAAIPLVYTRSYWLCKPWFRTDVGGRYFQDFVLLPH